MMWFYWIKHLATTIAFNSAWKLLFSDLQNICHRPTAAFVSIETNIFNASLSSTSFDKKKWAWLSLDNIPMPFYLLLKDWTWNLHFAIDLEIIIYLFFFPTNVFILFKYVTSKYYVIYRKERIGNFVHDNGTIISSVSFTCIVIRGRIYNNDKTNT